VNKHISPTIPSYCIEMDHYNGSIPAQAFFFESWRLCIEESEREVEANNTFYECYNCHSSFRDIAIVRMVKGNEEVWACLACRSEGLKLKGSTKTPELHEIVKPEPLKRALWRHDYYEKAPSWCDCSYCEVMTESDKIALWGPRRIGRQILASTREEVAG
jgi:hypothetical protein